jgi:hypothetical protein
MPDRWTRELAGVGGFRVGGMAIPGESDRVAVLTSVEPRR